LTRKIGCARKACHTVKDSIKPKNCGCAQSWLIDMAVIEKRPSLTRTHGGARPGCGRKGRFSPENVAAALVSYAESTPCPSVRHFCSSHAAVDEKQIRRWELKHVSIIQALAVLRLKNERDRGIAT
jgi:hypothetical protein